MRGGGYSTHSVSVPSTIYCSTTNYRQLSGKLSSMVYFDPKAARDSLDCGRCLGAQFDEWERFAL